MSSYKGGMGGEEGVVLNSSRYLMHLCIYIILNQYFWTFTDYLGDQETFFFFSLHFSVEQVVSGLWFSLPLKHWINWWRGTRYSQRVLVFTLALDQQTIISWDQYCRKSGKLILLNSKSYWSLKHRSTQLKLRLLPRSIQELQFCYDILCCHRDQSYWRWSFL